MTGALTDFQSQDVQEAARKGIGSELRRLFGLRSDVPHQMLALLVQLSDDPSGLKVGQLHSAIHRAFRNACQAMQIEVDADLAHADLILDKIIEVVRQGESDPEVICSVVLRELGERSRLTQERPNSRTHANSA